MRLREHDITLHGEAVRLRPMTEDDWGILLRWNSDPEVLYFSEGDTVDAYTLPEVQDIYRGVSQQAFCFVIEAAGALIGEGWLQHMNLDRVLRRYPGKDCRRVDLMIGEKKLWGHGLGTDVIRTLTRFGFEQEQADAIFGCDIADYNPRSLRAFQRVGFRFDATHPQPSGAKAHIVTDVVMLREEWPGRA
ncbi:MAG: GNAT family N-acetyltransferase [Anaerolineales bacterium]|nr:GNAT family N-acetyltransferase [Anaerolineales bacterium]